ncbi:MAG: hypothetical protein ACKVRP_01635 [Bacteroidota bacterium]
MAVAKFTCGNCRSEIALSDKFCASCGDRVEVAGATKEAAQIAGAVPQEKHAAEKPTQKKRSSFRPEPWHYYFGGAVLLLLAYFIYSEVTREHPSIAAQQAPVQASTPALDHEVVHDIERLEKAANENPNDAAALLQLANRLHDAALKERSLLAKTIATYTRYLEMRPEDPNARVDLGICYFEMGRSDSTQAGRYFSMAINEMESTIKANPTHQSAAFNLGIVTLFAGNTTQSTSWFKRAVEINPESDLGKRAKNLLEQHAF